MASGSNKDGRQVLIISLPGNMAPATGMKLKLDNFETTVGNCTCSKACIAVSLLDGRMQALMLASQVAEMTYEARSGRTVHLTASMAGFEVALQAAAEDPFGKRLKVMTAKPPIPTPRPPTTRNSGFNTTLNRQAVTEKSEANTRDEAQPATELDCLERGARDPRDDGRTRRVRLAKRGSGDHTNRLRAHLVRTW